MTEKERHQEYKLKHKHNGICVECTSKAVEGRTRCLYHLEVQRKAVADKRAARRLGLIRKGN